jgi:hypothetical protein
VNDIGVMELPLLDRLFTWSSRREDPSLRVYNLLVWLVADAWCCLF